MKRAGAVPWIAALAMFAATLAPAVALACPTCAGRDGPGLGALLAVGGMILAPYLVALVAVRVIRRLDQQRVEQSAASPRGARRGGLGTLSGSRTERP